LCNFTDRESDSNLSRFSKSLHLVAARNSGVLFLGFADVGNLIWVNLHGFFSQNLQYLAPLSYICFILASIVHDERDKFHPIGNFREIRDLISECNGGCLLALVLRHSSRGYCLARQ